jgi:hypothetical protein
MAIASPKRAFRAHFIARLRQQIAANAQELRQVVDAAASGRRRGQLLDRANAWSKCLWAAKPSARVQLSQTVSFS